VTLFDAPGTGGGTETGDGPAVCRFLVAYDGTDFSGFAIQPGRRTVAGVLGKALGQVLRTEVDLACAGRTDTGVHAWGQVVSFEAPPGVDVHQVQASMNSMLGPEIVVRSADLMPAGFDARYSARSRTYRYTIVNRSWPDPFRTRYAWHVHQPLDLHALRLAADPFVGEHDFATFCKKGPEGTTTVRRVYESAWHDLGDGLLRYDVRARAFCTRMVRSMVGAIVDAGLGKRRPGDMLTMMRAADRAAVGTVAPPHGLCLWEVGYPDD